MRVVVWRAASAELSSWCVMRSHPSPSLLKISPSQRAAQALEPARRMADGEVLPPIESKSRVGSAAVSREGSRPASATAPDKLPSIKDKPGSNGHAKSPPEEDGHRENGTGDSRGEDNRSEGSGEDDGDASSRGGTARSHEGNQVGMAEEGSIEDPEAEFWRKNAAVLKNSKAVAKELAKRLQSAIATKKLDIGEMELNMIPDKVFELEGLRILWAHTNNIQVVPKLVGQVKELTQLRLFGNQLRWLPDEVGDCVALQTLFIQNNQLIALPGTIGNLTQLKILAVARNPLRSLPHELQKCINLKEIDFEGLEDFLSVPPVDVIRQVQHVCNTLGSGSAL